jgi:multiple sugar transport system permease protein
MNILMIKLVFLLLAASSFSWAQPTTSSDATAVTINLGAITGPDDPRTLTDRIGKEVLSRFKSKYPNYSFKLTESLRLTNQLSMDAVVMQMAGGTAPDVITIPFRNAINFIDQGFVYPLDDYFEKWKQDPKVDINEIVHPAVWQVIKQQGHVYYLPTGDPGATVLMYRKDLFKKAGLTRPPQTWDELFEYAKLLTDPEKGQYGYGIFGGSGSPGAWHFTNFIWQAGGEIVKRDQDGNWMACYNDAGGVAALTFYHKLLRYKWTKNGQEITGVSKTVFWRLWDEFQEGKIAMVISDIGTVMFSPDLNPDLITIAPLPAGPVRSANMINVSLMGMNATIKDKVRRDAVWDYMSFSRSDEAGYITTKNYVEAGFAKFLAPKLLKKYGFERYIKQIPAEWLSTYDAAMATGIPEPYQRGGNMIYGELTPAMQEIALKDTVNYQQVLDKLVAHTNEKLLDRVSPHERKKRKTIALIVVLCLGLLIVFYFIKIIKSVADMAVSSARRGGTSTFKNKHIHIWAWCLMFPALATVLLWHYYPLLRGMMIAFMDYNVITTSKFIGLDNFIKVFWQPDFWIALKNTLVYVVLSLSMGFFAPVILALLLNEIPKGSLFFRVIYYLPAVTSSLVVTLLWMRFYDPTPVGFFNQVLVSLGFEKPSLWLTDPHLAMICVIVPGIWSHVGAGCIFYLAALKNIPEELYEAADLDGAGVFRKTWNITFATLAPLLIINFMGALIGAFQATERILVMTGGGPLKATHTLGLEIFYNAFTYMKFGYATAVAWVMGAMIIGFTVFQIRMLKNMRFTARGSRE